MAQPHPISARGSGRAEIPASRASAANKKTSEGPLTSRELELMNAYWRACNYLSVGMIYLKDNPLLTRPLAVEDVKHRLLGHWGASPALSFCWLHMNRLINKLDLDVIFAVSNKMDVRVGLNLGELKEGAGDTLAAALGVNLRL